MLTLPEKLMLLALDDEKGTVVFSASTALPYGLAGSLLIELQLNGKINLSNGKVEVVDETGTGDELLDQAINLIKSSKKKKDVKYWVQKVQSGIKDLEPIIVEGLISKGILRSEKHKILWVFPTERFPLSNVSSEQEIRNRIFQVVMLKNNPSDEDIALLSLVNACDLYHEVFAKEHRKTAKKRVKEIISEEKVGQAVSSVVAEIIVAVSVAASAAITAASSASY